ncbi:MAG TPA: site-2 protease family protein [Vicinamibacterales bacterium]|nr:site-2 protease family protein [Vicinamibacterales bacterium]
MSVEILLPFFAILVMSLSFHEAAHAWAANRLGDPTARQLGRLTLNPIPHIDPIGTVVFPLMLAWSGLPIFGWAKPVPVNGRNLRAPRRDFAMVALAGPVSNVLLAFIASTLLSVVFGSRGAVGITSVDGFLTWVVQLNLLLAVFNMIPVPPLDGGNVLAGFVPESVARMIDALRPWGFLILMGLLVTGALWQFVGPIYSVLLRLFL